MSLFKGYLKLIVLKSLEKKEVSGYDLCRIINKETGWKPSYGSIYPLLNNLLEKKIVKVKKEGKKKVYSLTKKGETELRTLLKSREKLIKRITESIKLYDVVTGLKISKNFIPLLNEMKKNENPFLDIELVSGELKENIAKLMIQKNKDKNERLKKILIQANKEVLKII